MDILGLTKSRTREKILRLFFSDVEKKYYLRELERILDLPVGNIRRELLRLEKSGLFKKDKRGNLIYYSVNKLSPIYKEVKSIISKTIGVEGLMKNDLKRIKDIKIAFIFGSYAKQEEDSFSDIDLMIIGNPDEDALIVKVSKIEKKVNREINYHIFSISDWKEKIKENNPFIKNILIQAKIFLIGNQDDLSRLY